MTVASRVEKIANILKEWYDDGDPAADAQDLYTDLLHFITDKGFDREHLEAIGRRNFEQEHLDASRCYKCGQEKAYCRCKAFVSYESVEEAGMKL